jgi:hypothetical protein
VRVEEEAQGLGPEVEVFPEPDEVGGEAGVGEVERQRGGSEEHHGSETFVEGDVHVELARVPRRGSWVVERDGLDAGGLAADEGMTERRLRREKGREGVRSR